MAGYALGKMLGLENYKDKTVALVHTAQESAYKIGLALLTFTAILWMSVFLYATFYYSYVPAQSHLRPVHLQYESCGNRPGICSDPSAIVQLTEKQRLLMVGQPYKVVVELELPETPKNLDAGMFLVCGELRDGVGYVVEKSCRSAMLHYRSPIHRLITTLLYFPFLLSGSVEEKQIVGVELFSGFQEHPDRPAVDAHIQIESQHIQVYGTNLKIHAHFTGLRYFMFHWPILAAGLGISTNFFFLALIAFLSWWKFWVKRQKSFWVGYDAGKARQLIEIDAEKEKIGKEKNGKIATTNPDQCSSASKDKIEDEIPKLSSPKRKKPKKSSPKVSHEKDKLEEMEEDSNSNSTDVILPTTPITQQSTETEEEEKENKGSGNGRSSEEFEILSTSTGTVNISSESEPVSEESTDEAEDWKAEWGSDAKTLGQRTGTGGKLGAGIEKVTIRKRKRASSLLEVQGKQEAE